MNAAKRLGFRSEGMFRQAAVLKGRNRDTAWFSITDPEWPAAKEAFESWLASDNFDAQGQQINSLCEFYRAKDDHGAVPKATSCRPNPSMQTGYCLSWDHIESAKRRLANHLWRDSTTCTPPCERRYDDF